VARGAADLVDLEQDRVGVAVDEGGPDSLDVAALFTLLPEPLATAAVVDGFAGGDGRGPGRAVHVREHEYAACRGVLDRDREQGVVVTKVGQFGHERCSSSHRTGCTVGKPRILASMDRSHRLCRWTPM
jgi:hypothetical protein